MLAQAQEPWASTLVKELLGLPSLLAAWPIYFTDVSSLCHSPRGQRKASLAGKYPFQMDLLYSSGKMSHFLNPTYHQTKKPLLDAPRVYPLKAGLSRQLKWDDVYTSITWLPLWPIAVGLTGPKGEGGLSQQCNCWTKIRTTLQNPNKQHLTHPKVTSLEISYIWNKEENKRKREKKSQGSQNRCHYLYSKVCRFYSKESFWSQFTLD